MAQFCSNCGKELKEGVAFCEACGAPVNNIFNANHTVDNHVEGKGLAIAGLVVSIIGVCVPLYGFLGGLLGLIFGIIAKRKAVQGNPYKVRSVRNMATADIVLGIIGMALWVVVFIIATAYMSWKYGWDSLW